METYYGHVRTPNDAILLFEACRIGLLPRVQRRLSEKERLSIRSGSVFVWDEREAGMRRWTDGKSWSASRVSGSFLTYREMEGKRGGSTFSAPTKPVRDTSRADPDGSDDGPDGYRYKPDGLIKQSFSITTDSGQHLHLISYFARSAAAAQNLQFPSNDPQLRHIRPERGMYPEATAHEQNPIPAVTRGPMSSPAFANSPRQSAQLGSPYARPGPPPYAPVAYTSYGWAPPSPMNTPPPHYSPYHYSPMQHLHHYAPGHPQHYPPALTAFDRAPAPLSSSALPLPPPNYPQMLPPHHHTHPLAHPSNYPAPSLPAVLSEPHSSHPPSAGHTSVDPALSATNGYERKPEILSHRYHDTAPGAQNPAENTTRHPATLAPVSSATTIPSISSLINDDRDPAPSQRPASRSPLGNQIHTQDIPMHKMGYDAARDVQALRHLDKATLRF